MFISRKMAGMVVKHCASVGSNAFVPVWWGFFIHQFISLECAFPVAVSFVFWLYSNV
jgi:hypothetical protein